MYLKIFSISLYYKFVTQNLASGANIELNNILLHSIISAKKYLYKCEFYIYIQKNQNRTSLCNVD